jgi:VWFA-related protein
VSLLGLVMFPRSKCRVLLYVFFALLVGIGWALVAYAQNESPQERASASVNEERVPHSDTTFRADVNVVNLFFNVKDKKGALIPGLTKDDFEVFEDGKPQTIKYFSAESNQPLTLGIMIDSSLSQGTVLDMEKRVGGEFLRQVLREKDLAYVISFDVNVDLLQDFTNSVPALQRALNRATVNAGGSGGVMPGMGGGPFPTSGNPRGTLLYDAIWLGAHDKLGQEVGRKAMIVLTDGEDQGSQESLKDAVEAAQKADVIVYVILIADRQFYLASGMNYTGDSDVKKVAEATGGRVIDVGKDEKRLQKAFDEISNELRSQYSVGYTPTNAKRDGTFRRVEIRPKKKEYKIQTRTGYYAIKSRAGD